MNAPNFILLHNKSYFQILILLIKKKKKKISLQRINF